MPHTKVVQGATKTLSAIYKLADGTLVDPLLPRLEITDSLDIVVATGLVPVQDGVGLYHYDYVVPAAGALGVWIARWTGVINGVLSEGLEAFEVIAAGAVPPSVPTAITCSSWTTDEEVRACCPALAEATSTAVVIPAASEILYLLSGRQFPGLCTAELRPCDVACSCGCHFASIGPGPSRRCCAPSITLGDDIVSITEVLVDGAVVSPSLYRLDESRRLVRMADPDGSNPGWACCQRFDLPATELDTWQVTYTYGRDPPESGKLAAAELACHLALACDPATAGQCKLPPQVTSLTRQGVTMAFLRDTADIFGKGLTGLASVDLFISAFNPHHLQGRARVYSPDLLPGVRS